MDRYTREIVRSALADFLTLGDTKGSYALSTSGNDDGAQAGKYKVTIKSKEDFLAKAQADAGQLGILRRQLSYSKGEEIVSLLKQPNILALAGAASAEYGIGKVYKALDSAELMKFLENEATFHSQFQKFGNVEFQQTPRGGRMIYTSYPVYSPVYCASAVGFFLEAILRHGNIISKES